MIHQNFQSFDAPCERSSEALTEDNEDDEDFDSMTELAILARSGRIYAGETSKDERGYIKQGELKRGHNCHSLGRLGRMYVVVIIQV